MCVFFTTYGSGTDIVSLNNRVSNNRSRPYTYCHDDGYDRINFIIPGDDGRFNISKCVSFDTELCIHSWVSNYPTRDYRNLDEP
jgi:hypothetical protein